MTLASPVPSFKDRYRSEWARIGNPREIAAYGTLRALFRLSEDDVKVTGFGTGESGEIPGYSSIDEGFDFEVPSQGLIYEVTGTDKTLAESLCCCIARGLPVDCPQLFFRSGKVERAKIDGVVSRLVFISVNERASDTRYVPCSWLVKAPTVDNLEFPGCEPYHYIPWTAKALTGDAFKKRVLKRNGEGGWA